MKCCGLTNEVNSSENGPEGSLAELPRCGHSAWRLRLSLCALGQRWSCPRCVGPILVLTLRMWPSMARRVRGHQEPQVLVSGSAAGLSWQHSQLCVGVCTAEEPHTSCSSCAARPWTHRTAAAPSRKAPGPGQALRQLIPAWPGPATRSAGRAGRQRLQGKA